MTESRDHTLCRVNDLAATGAKEIVLVVDGARYAVVVVKHDVAIRAYINSCPHARMPLNWQEDKFFDLSGTYLMCFNHGAAFDIGTGVCVRGPAKGRALTPVAIRLENDRIVTDLARWPHAPGVRSP
jgi:nitrite reductase/ring-hydroxylating ferredoxin subunit